MPLRLAVSLFLILILCSLTSISPQQVKDSSEVTLTSAHEKPMLPDYFKPNQKKIQQEFNNSLVDALNADGTLKNGLEGSFDTKGYAMSYGANGQPIFTAKTLGLGDERWQSIPNIQGTNGEVFAIAISGTNVYVGGSFTTAGGITVNRIAMWNSNGWSALGTGVDNTVTTIATIGSNVYIGGYFVTAGGVTVNRVALWNGTTWSALGTGVNGEVETLTVDNGNLYVGGAFTSAGGVSASRIALWNGSAWSSLGFPPITVAGTIYGIGIIGSNIYVAGNFSTSFGAPGSNVAKWNGSTWGSLGSGLNRYALTLAVSGSKVYVGGFFTNAGGVAVQGIAVWDDNSSTWSGVGGGLPGMTLYEDIKVVGGNVYVAAITSDGFNSPEANQVGVWNGSSWSSLATTSPTSSTIKCLVVDGTNIYFGGNFTSAGGKTASRIALFDLATTNYKVLGSGVNNTVRAIALSGSNLYAGGNFTVAGATSVNNISLWSGSTWSALGTGVNGNVNAIAVSGGNVYVGGSFTSAGGVSVNNVAMWNGTTWSALGSGTNGTVRAISISGGNIYVGGDFLQAGGITVNRIALWNGSAWSTLGAGVGSTTGSVYAIAISGSNVYVGGEFFSAGGNSAARIAMWNGTAWSALPGTSFSNNGSVYALTMSGTKLFIGGAFTTIASNSFNRIAAFDTATNTWSALGIGANNGTNNTVNSIAVSGANVYVAGGFTSAGGSSINRIAVWNGITWSGLGTGLNNTVNALAISNANVFAGGTFSGAGDGTVSAINIIQRNGVFPDASLLSAAALSSDPKGVKLQGTVNSRAMGGNYYFEYGTTNSNLNQQTTMTSMSGSTDINVSADVFSGTPNTTYFYRLRVENTEGISYSAIQSYVFPPDIEVRQNVTPLSSGGEYDFGNVNYLASSSAIPFSVNNLGLGNLTLAGSAGSLLVKSGAHPNDFTVVQTGITSPLSFNSTQNFSVQFNPSSGGLRTAILTIASNDPDEPAYVINLKGTGLKLNQTITFNALTVRTIGDAPFPLSASTTSSLPVSFSSSTTTVATVSGNTVSIVGFGTTVITASQAGNANFNAAANVQQTLIVRAAEPGAEPTNLIFNNLTTSSINASFTSATGSPAGYLVLRKEGAVTTFVPVDGLSYSNGSTQGDAVVVASGASTSFSDGGLTAGTVYHYTIYAYNGLGVSTNYRTLNPLVNAVITIPAAPVASTASNVSQTGFTANWLASTGAVNYLLDVSSDNFSTLLPAYSAKPVTGLSDQINGLNSGTTYQYRVRASNASGLSTNSNTISQVTIPTTPVVNAAQEVRTNDFKITWLAVDGANGYQIDVSQNNFTSFIAGYQSKSVGNVTEDLVTGLSPASVYQYRIRAVNEGGASPNSIVGEVTTLSGAGTLTISNPVYNAATAKISVSLADGTGARLVKFYSRGITQAAFRSPQTLTSTSNTFEVTISPALFDDMGLEYFFTAEDAATSSPIRSPETGNNYIYNQINQGQITIPGLSFGGNTENYRIISVPYALTINTPGILFSSLGNYDKTKWRLLQYNGTNFIDNPSAIVPGRAYWFNARQQAVIELGAGSVVQNNQSNDFIFNLQQGWNMIATPFPFAINWEDVLAANPTANVDSDYLIFNPNITGFDVDNTMRPFEGGIVFANAATQLKFPVAINNVTAARNKQENLFERNLDAANWELPIRLQQGSRENNLIAVGMHHDAHEGKDKFDRATPPSFLDQPELFTKIADALAPHLLRDVVNQKTAHDWNFSVVAKEGSEAVLTWDHESISNNKAQLLLYDPHENVLIDMRKTGSYAFMPIQGKKLQILYTREELALESGFETASPNPFSLETKLPGYFNATGQKTKVTISIKSITGVEVFSDTYEIESTGLHQPVWTGNAKHGDHVNAGLYLFKVTYTNSSTHLSQKGRVIKQ